MIAAIDEQHLPKALAWLSPRPVPTTGVLAWHQSPASCSCFTNVYDIRHAVLTLTRPVRMAHVQPT